MHTPTRESFSGTVIFRDAADAYRFMFGADQHDQHVKRYRVRQKDLARSAHVQQVFRSTHADTALNRALRHAECA